MLISRYYQYHIFQQITFIIVKDMRNILQQTANKLLLGFNFDLKQCTKINFVCLSKVTKIQFVINSVLFCTVVLAFLLFDRNLLPYRINNVIGAGKTFIIFCLRIKANYPHVGLGLTSMGIFLREFRRKPRKTSNGQVIKYDWKLKPAYPV